MDIVMQIIAKLQRKLMVFHQQSVHNTDGTYARMVGILINLPKCPRQIELTEHCQYVFGQEHWPLGQRFPNQDFLTVPMWPFIDKVMWLMPPKDM